MNLSPDQKKWCIAINKGEIDGAVSFLKHISLLIEQESESINSIDFSYSRNKNVIGKNDDTTRPKNWSIFLENIKWKIILDEFFELWRILVEEKLIVGIYAARIYSISVLEVNRLKKYHNELSNDEITTYNNNTDFIQYYQVLFESTGYNYYLIKRLPTLDNFIKNDFKTDKELESERSHRNTIWAISISGALALISLIVSIYAINKAPELQPIRIINLDSALVKVSRSPLYRGAPLDSLSRAPSPRDTSLARVGKERGK